MIQESCILLYNASIVSSDGVRAGAVGIRNERISNVWYAGDDGTVEFGGKHIPAKELPSAFLELYPGAEATDTAGKLLMAGGIDAHVHFREPGLTAKADISSESSAAVLGGVTSFIDMPNTTPPTVSAARLSEKLAIAEGRSYANYGFHLGATNNNSEEIRALAGSEDFAGIKVFMGSSTGNMLVDNDSALKDIFHIKGKRVLVHCEDESIIRENMQKAIERYGEAIPFRAHEEIRSRKACIRSAAKALEMAIEYGTRLHLLHVSTAEEIEMVRAAKQINREITAETSANYLWFCDRDYSTLGSRIKCNPAIKSADDRDALRAGLKAGTVDTVGSDHAPHLATEKDRDYIHAPSGIPSIQHSLQVLLTVAAQEDIPLTRIAAAFSEKTAEIFHIQDRGYLKEGNFADIVIVDTDAEITATGEGLLYRCGWSPYEGYRLKGPVDTVFVNGETVVSDGMITGNPAPTLVSNKNFTPRCLAICFNSA